MEEMLEKARRSAAGKASPSSTAIDIDGVEGMLVKISQCCHPVPGDPIIGFITTGSGVSVHRTSCANLLATDPSRWVEVSWTGSPQRAHRVSLFIRAENRKKLLVDLSTAISADDANIVELTARTTVENTAVLDVLLEVVDLEHLQRVQQHLLQLPSVLDVRRQ